VVGIRAELESRGLLVVDLLEQWTNCGLERDTMFLPCDGHWNEAGQQDAFEAVRPFVGDMLESAALVRKAPGARKAGGGGRAARAN
jgi:hypothetical protein